MATTLESFVLDLLTPAQNPVDARRDAVQFGASLIVFKGQAVARKTADNKCYPLTGLSVGATNAVQTLAVDTIMSAGNIQVAATDKSGNRVFVNVAYTSSWTATLAAIVTALNAKLGTSAVAGAVTNTHDATFTFSGAGYAGLAQPLMGVDITAATGPTVATITTTTAGGATDGTANGIGLSQYTFATDSNGLVYYNGGVASPTEGYRTPPFSTSPIWISGIFDPRDLFTSSTPVAEVDTFTVSNPTTADVYTLTITNPDSSTHTVSATVGATQTATAISGLLIAAWNADPVAAAIATATGTATVILTAAAKGIALSVTGSVVGTGTVAKVVTTAATGANVNDIIAAFPGSRLLANGFLFIP